MIASVEAGLCILCRTTTPVQARIRAGTNLTGPSGGAAPGSAFDAAAMVGLQKCSLHSCVGVRVGAGAQYASYEDDDNVFPTRDVSLPTGFLMSRVGGEVYQITFGVEARVHFLASTDPKPQRAAAGLYAGYRF